MTEPSIIDYYSDYPKIVSVIDNLNKEYEELRKINEQLKKDILEISKKYDRELKECNSLFNLLIWGCVAKFLLSLDLFYCSWKSYVLFLSVSKGLRKLFNDTLA